MPRSERRGQARPELKARPAVEAYCPRAGDRALNHRDVVPRLIPTVVPTPLHEALASHSGDLPPLVGPITDISTALTVSSDPTLHRAAAELIPLALTWPRRPLHGDAHIKDVLMTATGPLWTDFEDVSVGPVEWDLASLTLTDDALNTYSGPVDSARLADCRDLRRLQVLASLVVGDYDEPALYKTLVTHLSHRHPV
ncbi:phosphotransferase [Nocardioides sp. dk4132]|uniref:phosphotransferase n=1 Tax=unclassified Nocardioides TaxID=2615069 RepID=UPI001295238A|nr:phosphotransferase [Nocardioides sp. dk4132]QGA08106.1 phosphotransferase [Nocardioides sp. dk884]